jgi:uroporphyrin-III C-methyltransferase
MSNNNKGKVIFIGAGPGDPELLTVKAASCLKKADIILTDRLVSQDILNTYCSEKALIIPVGKQCSRGASTPQATINELLVAYAQPGALVVRLKGGDVSVYSNILDELQTLVENEISFEIIPGITAASGAAAYAGIPLTARNYSTGVRFLTYYKSDILSDDYWKELSQTDDTLVFYMSAETLPAVVQKLISFQIQNDKLLAIIEQATTPYQRVSVRNLYDYAHESPEETLASPTLIIIGRVVALHEQFKWKENSELNVEYFKPVGGQLVQYTKHGKKLLTA